MEELPTQDQVYANIQAFYSLKGKITTPPNEGKKEPRKYKR